MPAGSSDVEFLIPLQKKLCPANTAIKAIATSRKGLRGRLGAGHIDR
jgi:hypothetical protein